MKLKATLAGLALLAGMATVSSPVQAAGGLGAGFMWSYNFGVIPGTGHNRYENFWSCHDFFSWQPIDC